MTEKMIKTADVAQLFNVTTRTITNWLNTKANFPKPIERNPRGGASNYWLASDLQAYILGMRDGASTHSSLSTPVAKAEHASIGSEELEGAKLVDGTLSLNSSEIGGLPKIDREHDLKGDERLNQFEKRSSKEQLESHRQRHEDYFKFPAIDSAAAKLRAERILASFRSKRVNKTDPMSSSEPVEQAAPEVVAEIVSPTEGDLTSTQQTCEIDRDHSMPQDSEQSNSREPVEQAVPVRERTVQIIKQRRSVFYRREPAPEVVAEIVSPTEGDLPSLTQASDNKY